MSERKRVTVEALVNAPIETVWSSWTEPEHVTKWNQASDDWHCPSATNDLRVGGSFVSRMEAKDGSFGFDFGGVYTLVDKHAAIHYTIGDGRDVEIAFSSNDDGHTLVTESFEIEDVNSEDLQRAGWQSIMNSFKNYTESLGA